MGLVGLDNRTMIMHVLNTERFTLNFSVAVDLHNPTTASKTLIKNNQTY